MLIAKIIGKNINYDMYKNEISIGRNSASGNVDIDMGNSTTFVSRKHLEILYIDNILKLRCLGKNGIFVDDLFKSHSSKSTILYDLPNKCHLRFPSTNVRLSVTLLAEPTNDCNDAIDMECKSAVTNYTFNNKLANYPILPQYDQSVYQDASALLSLKGNSLKLSPACTTDNHEFLMAKSAILNENQCNEDMKEDYLIKEEDSPPNQSYPSEYSNDDMTIDRGSELTKPPYSYAQLIVQAIMSSASHQMTLSGIYAYISQNYPYYKLKDKGWQNSIRHNLSLNRYFVKVARSQEEPGKGSFWRVDPHYKKPLIQQAFRRRRHRRLPMSSSVSIPEHAVLSNGKLFVPRGSTTLLQNDRPQFFKINKNLLGASWNSNQSINSSLMSSSASGHGLVGGQSEVLLSPSLHTSYTSTNQNIHSLPYPTSHNSSAADTSSPPPPALEPSNFQIRLMGSHTPLSDDVDDTAPLKKISLNKSLPLINSCAIQNLHDNRQQVKPNNLLTVESQELQSSQGQNPSLISLGGKLFTAVNLSKASPVPSSLPITAASHANLSSNKLPLYITPDGSKYLVLPQNTTADDATMNTIVESSLSKSTTSTSDSMAIINAIRNAPPIASNKATEDPLIHQSSNSQRLVISLPYQQILSSSANGTTQSITKKSMALPSQRSGPITVTLKRSLSPDANCRPVVSQQEAPCTKSVCVSSFPTCAMQPSSCESGSLSLIADSHVITSNP